MESSFIRKRRVVFLISMRTCNLPRFSKLLWLHNTASCVKRYVILIFIKKKENEMSSNRLSHTKGGNFDSQWFDKIELLPLESAYVRFEAFRYNFFTYVFFISSLFYLFSNSVYTCVLSKQEVKTSADVYYRCAGLKYIMIYLIIKVFSYGSSYLGQLRNNLYICLYRCIFCSCISWMVFYENWIVQHKFY